MSEISEIPMIEQSPSTKINQRYLERSITNVARKAEMEHGKPLEKPETTLTPTASEYIKSSDATTLRRLKNLAFEKAGKALRFSVDKVPLAASAAAFLVSIGCGNVERQNIPPSTPIPAVSELPGGIPSVAAVSEHFVTATPEPPSISAPTPEPTPASSPTPTIEPTPTTAPNPTENETIQKENKELIPYSSSITIIDAAPSVPTEGIIQKEFISNDEMIRNMLGDKYVSKEQLVQEFGQNYEEKWDEVVEKYPQALVHRLADTYFNHGEKVTGVIEDTLKRSGLESTGMNVKPLQKIFDKDSITFIKDSSGNPGVSLNFDSKRIIKLLEDNPSRVVNGSFQVGNVELFQETKVKTEIIPKYSQDDPRFSGGLSSPDEKKYYPGAVGIRANKDGSIDYLDAEGKKVSPMSDEEYEKMKLENSEVKEHKSTELEIRGAYTKEKAMENLPKLFEVCNAYPNKFFVFAGGNSGEDFREAMEALKDKTPKNLLIVAGWTKADYGGFKYEGPAANVYGPDIYVNNNELSYPSGSSFSTPVISAEVDMLLKKGFSFEQTKEAILAKSDLHTLGLNDGTSPTVRVFNPSRIQEK